MYLFVRVCVCVCVYVPACADLNIQGSWSPSKDSSPLPSKRTRGAGGEEAGAGRRFFDTGLENKVADLEKQLMDAKKEHAAAVEQEGEEIRRSLSQVNDKKLLRLRGNEQLHAEAKEQANVKAIQEQRDRYNKALQDENEHREQDDIFKLNKLRRHKKRWETSLHEHAKRIESPKVKSIVDSFKEQKKRYEEYVVHARCKNDQSQDRNLVALRKHQDRNKEYSHDEQTKKEQHEKEVFCLSVCLSFSISPCLSVSLHTSLFTGHSHN
jgi:hypothetical protein